jgi:glutamate/tyrosine decarboxylase-like PLP-dependent enzyme
MLEKDTLSLLRDALGTMERAQDPLPAFAETSCDPRAIADVLCDVAVRLGSDYPFFHPLYAGQMQQPPHPVARLAYALALWTNPNAHSSGGGRASAQMEREAVAQVARMFGWSRFAGHLCGGGTIANAEALWVASRRRPGAGIVASDQAHYCHARTSRALGLRFESLASDRALRLDTAALAARLARGGIGVVIATLGTTASGSSDAIAELLALRERYGFWLHVDASYGGYFGLAGNLDVTTGVAFERIGEVDSIVIDPHKHGLQPYGCSCVLFRDPGNGRFFRQRSPCAESPTTTAAREIGFECSRPGAAAVALWATMRLLPLSKDGRFAAMLDAARAAAVALDRRLRDDGRFVAGPPPDLDVVVWTIAAASAEEASANARHVLEECARQNLHLSLVDLPRRALAVPDRLAWRDARVACLRCVLMKPSHAAWVDTIFRVVCESTAAVVERSRQDQKSAQRVRAQAVRVPRPAGRRRSGVATR